MTKQLDELFALAREIEFQANAVSAGIDSEKARRLARIVLALDREVPVTDKRRRLVS